MKPKAPEIKNIQELAIYMASVKNGIGLKTDHMLVGAEGLKVQMQKQQQGNFKDYNEAMYFYIIPGKDENDELALHINKIWIDKTTGDVIEEPEWFKEHRNEIENSQKKI